MGKLRLGMEIKLKIGAGLVNAALSLALYIGDANCRLNGLNTPAVGVLAEIGCLIGVVAVAAILTLKRKTEDPLCYWMSIVLLTLWNQACLIAFLATLVAFYRR
jgi:hypothetical protein